MIQTELTISNKLGICARPAAQICKICEAAESTVRFWLDDTESKTADGSKIMDVVLLCAPVGATLHCTIDGPDEQETLEKLKEAFDSKFGFYD